MKKFDLNVEKILESWEIYHALREVIANALDEQVITGSKEIQIKKIGWNNYSIRDFGRGLKIDHLIQNEDKEKKNTDKLIGNFGVGLKDALVTLYRNNVEVVVKSKFLKIQKLDFSSKSNFEDIKTLHVFVDETQNEEDFIGTEFIFKNVNDKDIMKAKKLFLKFLKYELLSKNKYGEIYDKENEEVSNIFINGLKVAEEKNFLFNYNITSLTKDIRKALNRERTNVGRNAYSERIKKILLECSEENIILKLREDFLNLNSGDSHDEITSWIDIQEHIIKNLNSEKHLFITEDQINESSLINEAEQVGKKVLIIPKNLKNKILNIKDNFGNDISTLETFIYNRNENFEYDFVEINDLTSKELDVFNKLKEILNLINYKKININDIKISNTMQKNTATFLEACGLWDGEKIIIKRSELRNIEDFSSVLLHELAHKISNAKDATREFENELTRMLGVIVSNFYKK